MKDILLTELLEAGCHFGHKVERWHPKAASFIYQAREGVHIIDLGKTRDALLSAGEFFKDAGQNGKLILFVATKRQAKGVVTEIAKNAGLPYLTNRWIGGFITNWEEVKKNIDKLNKFKKEKMDGGWDKFPKHEIVKLNKELRKLEKVYGGVYDLITPPPVIFIVDCRAEITSLREAIRKNITTVALVDTNCDPTPIDYPIPANDDAVGSIQYIVNYLVAAYLEGRQLKQKAGIVEKVEGQKEAVINKEEVTGEKKPVKEKTKKVNKTLKKEEPKKEKKRKKKA